MHTGTTIIVAVSYNVYMCIAIVDGIYYQSLSHKKATLLKSLYLVLCIECYIGLGNF